LRFKTLPPILVSIPHLLYAPRLQRKQKGAAGQQADSNDSPGFLGSVHCCHGIKLNLASAFAFFAGFKLPQGHFVFSSPTFTVAPPRNTTKEEKFKRTLSQIRFSGVDQITIRLLCEAIIFHNIIHLAQPVETNTRKCAACSSFWTIGFGKRFFFLSPRGTSGERTEERIPRI